MVKSYCIWNKYISAKFKLKGAELCSLTSSDGHEFIWQAGEVWPKHAPNLFPIVGYLKDGAYTYEGQSYTLSHHGFARDLDFIMLHQSQHSICFVLQASAETKKRYPFDFTFLITYSVKGPKLTQKFRVINNGEQKMPVAFGAHPAFAIDKAENYYIEFSEEENAPSYALEKTLVSDKSSFPINENRIALSSDTFNEDALIFKNLKSSTVALKRKDGSHQVRMRIDEFPYLGIWAKPGAPFVCLEPWQGIADHLHHTGKMEEKEGMIWLEGRQEVLRSFCMEFTS